MAILFAAGTESIETAGAFAELAAGTITMWFNPVAIGGIQRIVGTDNAWETRLSAADLLHEFRQGAVPNSTTVFVASNWYHLAFTFDGTNKGVYVDALPDPVAAPFAHGAIGTSLPFSVGTSTWNPTQGINAEIEDVRMYNRVLTQAEVELIYNGKGHDGLLNGLQHWWTLDHGPIGSVVSSEPDIVSHVDLSVVTGTPIYTSSIDGKTFIRRHS